MSLSLETRFRIRTLLLTLTLATLPCYCAGFLLVDQANRRSFLPTPSATIPATRTPSSLLELHATPAPQRLGTDDGHGLDLKPDWRVYTWDKPLSE